MNMVSFPAGTLRKGFSQFKREIFTFNTVSFAFTKSSNNYTGSPGQFDPCRNKMLTFEKLLNRLGVRVTGGSNVTREDVCQGPAATQRQQSIRANV